MATGKEVRQLISSDGEPSPQQPEAQQGADGQHVAGPRDPAQAGQPISFVDTYGFAQEVSPEQAALLERCRARAQQQAAKWAALGPLGGTAGGELAPSDALKKLCRKVRRPACPRACLPSCCCVCAVPGWGAAWRPRS